MPNGKRMVTPPVEIRWASIINPNTRHDKGGVFEIIGLLDPTVTEHEDFLADLENAWIDGYNDVLRAEKKKNVATHDKPWKPDTDSEGNPTGLVMIRPKNKCGTYPSGDPIKVALVDAALNEVTQDPGNGSTCRLSIEANPFFHAGKYGLQLRLKGVQIIDLVEFKRTGGFEPTDGFVRKAAPARAAVDDGFAAAAQGDELPF